MPSLFAGRQALTKDQLIAQRQDLSQFLVHLTRSGTWRQWKDIYNLRSDNYPTLSPRGSLEDILKLGKIEARSPFGYFNFKVKMTTWSGQVLNQNSGVQRSWLQSVCFTETPVDFVQLQFQEIYGRSLQFEPYGLAFWEDSVRTKGGNPLFYFESRNQNLIAAMDEIATLPNCQRFSSFMPLVETFGPPVYKRAGSPTEIDFRWEREWRKPGDFVFSPSDIAFGFCEGSQIAHFDNLVAKAFPFVDPGAPMSVVKAKLRQWPRLANLK